MSIFNKNFRLIFLVIFLLEIISFCSFFVPELNIVVFFVLLILTLIISLYKLEYGILILLIELFIGSKGYLFYFEYGGTIISIRIALWLVIMAVWLGKFLIEFTRKRKIEIKEYIKAYDLKYLFILFAFIGWGLINSLLNNNDFSNIFFDFNGWLYFALIFPLLSIAKYSGEEKKSFFERFIQIFVVCISWLSLKTFIVLYIFSHNFIGTTEELYKWIRNSGVGEITQIQGGFYRIFFQSHIYIMVGFFIFFLLLIFGYKNYDRKADLFKNIKNNFGDAKIYFMFLTIFLSINIITLSRSNWVGLFLTTSLPLLFLVIKRRWKDTFSAVGLLLSATMASILIIVLIVKFPFPNPLGGFNTADLLAERASQISGEAGVSSRWSLLPELWNQIAERPILGKGFGSTVTYKSADPRILESTIDGNYTTYAFEWGWLDIWLKLGILGLGAYLLFLFRTMIKFKKFLGKPSSQNAISLGLILGLFAIIIVNIFSPYLNHPLGIGYLLFVSILLNKNEVKQ